MKTLTFLLFLIASLMLVERKAHADWLPPGEPILLGSELPNTRIESFYDFPNGQALLPIEPYQRLRFRVGSRYTTMHSLNELQGRVRISTPKAALKYVRLLTSPLTYLAWQEDRTEFELTRPAQFRRLPNYGQKDFPVWLADQSDSGLFGKLSDHAFTQGGFTQPKLTTSPWFHIVERWMVGTQCVKGRWTNAHVQKVQEIVTFDGGYVRIVLKNRNLPALPETNWTLRMMFE